jgi:hypothetical protein
MQPGADLGWATPHQKFVDASLGISE